MIKRIEKNAESLVMITAMTAAMTLIFLVFMVGMFLM
jgi:hypothetical protein